MESLGSNGSGFRLARSAGHAIVEPVPALVPLVVEEQWAREMPGVSLEDAIIRFDPALQGGAGKECAHGGGKRHAVERRGALLFTHHGISGPAALDISGAVSRHLSMQSKEDGGSGGGTVTLVIRPVAALDRDKWRSLLADWGRRHGGKALRNLLPDVMPRAFANAVCMAAGVPDTPLAQTGKAALARLESFCDGIALTVAATEGWGRSMVTSGGVSLSEIDPATMRSKIADGLSFAGEIVDLDAPCGGFNLTWAFASGALAAANAL